MYGIGDVDRNHSARCSFDQTSSDRSGSWLQDDFLRIELVVFLQGDTVSMILQSTRHIGTLDSIDAQLSGQAGGRGTRPTERHLMLREFANKDMHAVRQMCRTIPIANAPRDTYHGIVIIFWLARRPSEYFIDEVGLVRRQNSRVNEIAEIAAGFGGELEGA